MSPADQRDTARCACGFDPSKGDNRHRALCPDSPGVHPIIYALLTEINRQDEKHGPYQGTTLGRSRLALATLEDEVAEALEAWRSERKALHWNDTRAEVLQVAAVAIRTIRDTL